MLETRPSAPPSATASVPRDDVVFVASTSSEPPLASLAPASMVTVPCVAIAAGRETLTSPELATRTRAPLPADGPAIVRFCGTVGTAPLLEMLLPAWTSIESVAARISSGADRVVAEVLPTMMLDADGVTVRPVAVLDRTPPISRLASSLERLAASICR